MKARILIPLVAVLVGLLLVAGAPPKAEADYTVYCYAVKFTCGTAAADDMKWAGVVPGTYATDINIHNPGVAVSNVKYKVLRLKPSIKFSEPLWEEVPLPYNKGWRVNCRQICKMLGKGYPPPKYYEGFVVIEATWPVNVCAVYTMLTANGSGCSMDVEEYPHYTEHTVVE